MVLLHYLRSARETLYPLLHKMEKSGWIKSTGRTVKGKRRRYYHLTKKGQLQLSLSLTQVQQFLKGVLDVQPALRVEFSDVGHRELGIAQTS